jgi:hypothetical protein
LPKKIGETKLSSKQIKQDDTHTKSVKINDATMIKIVDQKSCTKHSGDLIKINKKPRQQ